jgi:dihydrofolate synthase/folylpolyglutamate synthase
VTYKQALEYMFAQLPMFSRIGPAAFKKDLSNTIQLLHHLDNPQQKFKSIHIAGTNGKGSVSHLLAAVLKTHQIQSGLYTSPHYKDFRERIKLNGEFIEKRAVAHFIDKNRLLLEQIKPSYFEMTVAMAFHYFAMKKAEWAVVETGLGGRLDSTNVITPALSVITNISFDHMDMLGHTLPAIGFEKAGIIKNNIPVIIGERQDEVTDVFMQKAKQVNSPIYFAEDLCVVECIKMSKGKMKIHIDAPWLNWKTEIDSDLYGAFQIRNIRTAIGALSVIQKHQIIAIKTTKITNALKTVKEQVKIMGRMQWLSSTPGILVDSAHNIAGISMLIEEVSRLEYNRLHIIFGTVNDKSPEGILSMLPKNANYYFTQARIPRAMPVDKLLVIASEYNLVGKAYKSVRNALSAAKRNADESDLILVCGSIFVAAEVL